MLAFDLNMGQGGIPKYHANWQRKDHEYAVLSTCSSLISIVGDNGSQVVQFSHFSVKEFLMSNRLATSTGDVSRYHIFPGHAHTIIARVCSGFFSIWIIPSMSRTSRAFLWQGMGPNTGLHMPGSKELRRA